jgi:hypothetical protein
MNRELAVVFCQCCLSCGRSLLACVVQAIKDGGSIFPYASAPLTTLRMEANPCEARGVVPLSMLIKAILGIVSEAKVIVSVIRSNSILVINLIRRPVAMHVTPYDVVRVVVCWLWVRNLNVGVSLDRRASDGSGVTGVPLFGSIRLVLPAKKSGCRVVIEKGSDEFGAQRRSAFDRHFGSFARGTYAYIGFPFMSTETQIA